MPKEQPLLTDSALYATLHADWLSAALYYPEARQTEVLRNLLVRSKAIPPRTPADADFHLREHLLRT